MGKTETLHLRLTPIERSIVEHTANAHRVSISEVVRTMIRQNRLPIVANEKTGAMVSTARPGLHD